MKLPFKTEPVFTLIIGGKPMPCPRPRKGKHGVYMPPKYMAHKEEMIKQIKRLMEDKGIVERISGPLAVSIVFVHKRTRDLKKKSAPDSRVFKVTRPDIDNLQKTIFDALQGAELFWDDSQIALSAALDMYSSRDEDPHTEITIERIVEEPC